MFGTPAIIAIFLAIVVSLSFAGGYALADWKDANKIRILETDNGVLTAANDRCATDIQGAKTAYTELKTATDAREKAANTAMAAAEPEAKTHAAKARQLQALPPVPLDRQCDTITREQIVYVEARRN